MRRKATYTFFIALFLLVGSVSVVAQNAEAEAVIDNTAIRIGEQCTLKLFVRYNEGTKKSTVVWPLINDTLAKNIEFLSNDTVSTKLVDRASVLYEQKCSWVLTCFDSGTWVIPGVPLIVDKDTVWTEPVELYVNTVPVDTTKPIKDIADIYDVPAPPPELNESNAAMWWCIGGSILVLTSIVLFLLLRKKKTPPVVAAPIGHILLPHEVLLNQLNEMYVNKPWKDGNQKKHHTHLSELMRGWVVERFRFHAREMTTFEIVLKLRRAPDAGNKTADLEHVLRTADLVKFAKAQPDDFVNEKCIEHAIEYVKSTSFQTVHFSIPPINPMNQ